MDSVGEGEGGRIWENGIDAQSLSHVQLFVTPCSPWNSPGQNTGVGSLSLLQGIFPTQESNWGLLHCAKSGLIGKDPDAGKV